MRIPSLLAFVAWLCLGATADQYARNHETHDYYTLHLHPGTSPAEVASVLGLQLAGKTGELPNHWTFANLRSRGNSVEGVLENVRKRRRRRDRSAGGGALDGILWSQKQKLKRRMEKRNITPKLPTRTDFASPGDVSARPVVVEAAVAMRDGIARELDIQDPIFGEQWHLFNTIQLGHDVNVTGVWTQGITGQNTTLVMVDDGIDMYSEDLKANYFAAGSYDFNDKTDEPKPRLSDDKHGTRCAGEIAAVKNGVCGVGVAYDAKIGGIRILSKVITDEDEAVAMNYAFQQNQIYSCSWGPPDDGRSMDAPGILIKKAMVNAIQNGRQGKGNIYVFAAGNGAGSGDNCNFDGYTNSIYSITVGAIDRKGLHPYYSEECSAQLVVTYSSGSGDAIHTTDVGTNQCYSNHGGTSAAAPLGAGIFGLALSVRPELTWRDMQSILVQTAVPVNEHEVWDKTYIGKKFSHTYGYGKLDAYAVVEAAKSATLLKPQAWFNSPWLHVNREVPQGVEGLLSTFEVTKEHLQTANLERVEHVTVTMNVEHTRRGDLSVELRSPTNVVSHLSVARRLDDAESGYVDWTFMSVAHWGEPGVGKWSVVVKDTNVNEHNGTFTDWKLTLWGECIDPSSQKLLPMPEETDDDSHTVISAEVSTATVPPNSAESDLPANPSDHIDRPVNVKPTGSAKTIGTTEALPTAWAPLNTAVTSFSSSIHPTVSSSAITTLHSAASSSSADNALLHYFPTFGVSKRTQIWIYGALAIIVLFCAGLTAYIFVQRRKRIRHSRDEYDFDVLEGDEDDGVHGLAKVGVQSGAVSGKGRRVKKRAGELYDAFAGESDEELLTDGEEEYKYVDMEEEEEDDDDAEGEVAERGRSQSRGRDGEKT